MVTAMVMVTGMDMKTEFSIALPLTAIMLWGVSGASFAQQSIPGAISSPSAGAGIGIPGSSMGASRSGTDGDEPDQERTWTIRPRVTLTETLSDNISINRGSNGKQSDLISELTPGVRIEARTARLKGYFDYALRGQFYAKTDYSRTQNSLNSFGSFEAIDNFLFLDFSGVIAQQAISALGTQSPGNTSINNNITETSTYRLSPYIRGQIGGSVDYFLRYNTSTSQSSATTAYNVNLSQWAGQLRGSTPFQNLRWSLDGTQQTADYANGRKTEAETLKAFLTYSIFPEFRVSLSGGKESNNYASIDQETHNTYGGGFDWNPGPRTQVFAFKERRFFGDGHNVRLSHRFPRSSIRFTDTRDVSVLPNQFATVGLGSVYDLYFDQFENLIPNAVTRANFVNALLAQSGIDPNTQVTSGFLTTRATVQRRQQLALALFGNRNSITFLANRNENQTMLASSAVNDDFAQSNSTTIRQQGFSLNYSHRLGELTNLNALLSRQKSTSNGRTASDTTMTLYQINVSTRLGAHTTGSVSVRRSEFDSTTNPYTENALLGTISYIY